jgi:Fe-S cluster biogenesis protein NfuA
MSQNPVTIYLESNPNPNSLKFVANYMLVEPGESYDFPDALSAADAPLAKMLFNFPFVSRVFYMSNFITVTKVDSVDWSDVQEQLKAFIRDYLESGKPLLTEAARATPGQPEHTAHAQRPAADLSEMDIKIKGLLDEYIKPAVEQDGGAIQFHSFNDGVVKVLLQGSCSGCPSSMVTLKAGIENLLKTMIPEVQSVEAEEL